MRIRSRNILLIAIALAVLGAIFIGVWGVGGKQAAKYKTELRAKGEKLSFEELGYPHQLESIERFIRFTNAASQLTAGRFDPGTFSTLRFGSGRTARPVWREPAPLFTIYGSTNQSAFAWPVITAELQSRAEILAAIRLTVAEPPARLIWDPANQVSNSLRYPFPLMRSGVHWLMADTVEALHTGDDERALNDVHALARMGQFFREDPVLVAQMVRAAVANVGLAMTWEALQKTNWTDAQLGALQNDWAAMDFLQALELAMIGERAYGEEWFERAFDQGVTQATAHLTSGFGVAPTLDWRRRLRNPFVNLAWRLNADADEVLLLRHYQGMLEMVRGFQSGQTAAEAEAQNSRLLADLNQAFNEAKGWNTYKYQISAMTVPNYAKATTSMVRSEAQRRFTLVAIALERYRLRHGRYPAALNALAPEFLANLPMDLISGQAFRYHLDAANGFVLYSIGLDGKDDGGDPELSPNARPTDCFSGRDILWPRSEP